MRSLRYVIVGLVLVLSIEAVAVRLWPYSLLLPGLPKAHASTVTISLSGCSITGGACVASGWNGTTLNPNPTIAVAQGETVTVHLTSADKSMHQFVVDMDSDDDQALPTDCPQVDPCSNPFTTSTTYSFTATTNGTYTYFCAIHFYMSGIFTVNPGQTVGGVTTPVDKLSLLATYGEVAAIFIGTLIVAAIYVRHRSGPVA